MSFESDVLLDGEKKKERKKDGRMGFSVNRKSVIKEMIRFFGVLGYCTCFSKTLPLFKKKNGYKMKIFCVIHPQNQH